MPPNQGMNASNWRFMYSITGPKEASRALFTNCQKSGGVP